MLCYCMPYFSDWCLYKRQELADTKGRPLGQESRGQRESFRAQEISERVESDKEGVWPEKTDFELPLTEL